MLINRSKLGLVLCLPLLLTSVVSGQELPDYEWVPNVRDWQPFGPASDRTSPYGGRGPKRNKGWFFTIEDLYWSTTAPERSTIGDPNFTPLVSADGQAYFQQQNSLDTSFIQPNMRQGERLQIGSVGDDGLGWLVGTFVVHGGTNGMNSTNAGVSFSSPNIPGVPGNETQGFIDNNTNGAFVFGNGQTVLDTDVNHNGVFGQDGRGVFTTVGGVRALAGVVPAPVDWGDLVQLPIYFQEVSTKYTSNVWGIEVMRTGWLSSHQRHNGSEWDWMAGARYIRFRDQFTFNGTGSSISGTATVTSAVGSGSSGSGGGTGGTTTGNTVTGPFISTDGLLSQTFFAQTAANYMVGPQIGIRWKKERGRLSMEVEGRFTAAANFQSLRQTGVVADQTDASSQVAHYTHLQVLNNYPQLAYGPANGGSSVGVLPPVQVDTPFLHSASVYHVSHPVTFSPIGELRINARYQIFRNITATVGWTGLVLGGVARSPNVISYSLPNMGILNSGNRQAVLIQGINFGFTVNR